MLEYPIFKLEKSLHFIGHFNFLPSWWIGTSCYGNTLQAFPPALCSSCSSLWLLHPIWCGSHKWLNPPGKMARVSLVTFQVDMDLLGELLTLPTQSLALPPVLLMTLTTGLMHIIVSIYRPCLWLELDSKYILSISLKMISLNFPEGYSYVSRLWLWIFMDKLQRGLRYSLSCLSNIQNT